MGNKRKAADLPSKATSAAQPVPPLDISTPNRVPADITLDVSTSALPQAPNPTPTNQLPTPRGTKKTLPTVVEAESKKRPKPQPPAPPAAPTIVSEGLALDIALVNLFAGLRAVHVAAKGTRIKFVLTAAAEKCPFAEKLAKINHIL